MTLALPKVGLRAAEVAGRVGELYLADISVPPALYAAPGLDLHVGPLFSQTTSFGSAEANRRETWEPISRTSRGAGVATAIGMATSTTAKQPTRSTNSRFSSSITRNLAPRPR